MVDNGGFPDIFYSRDPLPTRIVPVFVKKGKNENTARICWNMIVIGTEQDERQKSENSHQIAPYVDNDEGLIDCMDLEDNYEILPTKSGKFITSFYIPSALLPAIVGPKGIKLKQLQDMTQTLIKVPRYNEKGKVKITGHSERSVASSRNQVALIALSKREKLDSTHFISIPFTSESIVSKFRKFKSEILNGPRYRGVEESIFQSPEKLHLTIEVLTLLDEDELEDAKRILTKHVDVINESIMSIEKKLMITLHGIEIMNDDPNEVDVLYGKIQMADAEENEYFQRIVNTISNLFYRNGYVRKQYDNVKLHVTLMNSLYRNTDGKKRETFDATFILENYRDYHFGNTEFDKIDISIRFTTGKNNYYDSAISVPVYTS